MKFRITLRQIKQPIIHGTKKAAVPNGYRPMLETFQLTQIRYTICKVRYPLQQTQTILFDLLIFGHHQHFIEESVDGGNEFNDNFKEFVNRCRLSSDVLLNDLVKLLLFSVHQLLWVNFEFV